MYQEYNNEYTDITVGHATVVKHVEGGWIIPGNLRKVTLSYKHAQNVAIEINKDIEQNLHKRPYL